MRCNKIYYKFNKGLLSNVLELDDIVKKETKKSFEKLKLKKEKKLPFLLPCIYLFLNWSQK